MNTATLRIVPPPSQPPRYVVAPPSNVCGVYAKRCVGDADTWSESACVAPWLGALQLDGAAREARWRREIGDLRAYLAEPGATFDGTSRADLKSILGRALNGLRWNAPVRRAAWT